MTDYTIDLGAVQKGYSATICDVDVDGMIQVVNQADACLAAKSVSAEVGRNLKVLAVRHMLALTSNNGAGVVASERSASGAARSFAGRAGSDITSTSYGALLQQLDKSRCVVSLFVGSGSSFLMTIGGSSS